jgi:UDP-glucuronate 4-epimerase
MKILITGTAGFIGFHLANRLILEGNEVRGIDNLNTYYDVSLKHNRLADAGIAPQELEYSKTVLSSKFKNYSFVQLNMEDKAAITKCFEDFKPEIVVNLAAQAGVRYSIINPDTYVTSNITGFLNILEGCRNYNVKHLVYASSSSVYGLNNNEVFSTDQNVDHPISLYAATKKSNELMAHTYSHLFGIPTTGLRFFTVYGPWGRPDMALFLFTKAIINNQPIEVYNNGEMYRDFTYIDDIVDGIVRAVRNAPQASSSWISELEPDIAASSAPYKIYNIGNNKPVKLTDFIDAIEAAIGKKANRIFKPLQPGDVVSTYADISSLTKDLGYKPVTEVNEGVVKFVNWYRNYYKV